MKILSLLVLAGLAYGFVRFMFGTVKELAEIVAEAWHSGETEH